MPPERLNGFNIVNKYTDAVHSGEQQNSTLSSIRPLQFLLFLLLGSGDLNFVPETIYLLCDTIKTLFVSTFHIGRTM